MTNDHIKRLASDIIEQANIEISRMNMHKDGWLNLKDARVKARLDGQIAAANRFLDAVAAEETAEILNRARAA